MNNPDLLMLASLTVVEFRKFRRDFNTLTHLGIPADSALLHLLQRVMDRRIIRRDDQMKRYEHSH
jgi:hypothetical protein